LEKRAEKLIFYQQEIGMNINEFPEIFASSGYFTKVVDLWDTLYEWDTNSNKWIMTPVLEFDAIDSSNKMAAIKKKMVKLLEFFKEKPELHKLCLSSINGINLYDINYMEIMLILRDESFKERHWKELLGTIFSSQAIPELSTLNFKLLIEKNIRSHKSYITQLAELARNQYIFEFKIEEIQKSLGNTQVLVRVMTGSKQLMIANPQTIYGAFLEGKEKCEKMLRVSEHLEAFLKKIYDVYSNTIKLENYFNCILTIQDYLFSTRISEIIPSIDSELSKRDRTLFKSLVQKYHNILDDMKYRGSEYAH
jgi:hypothetical protein